MNNLKRILSLALASVMVLGMMVVGASAANFTDNEDITHEAAADVMNALGIIGGYEDGSFRPNGDVNRAEMAKMLSVALNGGKDPNVGLPTTIPYSDVKTTDWFAEYVMYCSNLNIIGGRGNGTFDPYGNVTAAEAAKMILVALGFDPEIFELVGANWSTNTMRLATTLLVGDEVETAKPLSLFADITGITANQPLNRDQAAQLIYNGIQANTVKMALTGVTGSGVTGGIIGETTNNRPQYSWSLTGKSILEDKFNADWKEGVLTKADYNSTTADWTYTVSYADAEGNAHTLEMSTAMDVADMFMQNIRVIYQGETNDPNKKVLAIAQAGNSVVKTTVWGNLKLDETKLTVDGYGVNVAADEDLGDFPVYDFLKTPASTNGLDLEGEAATHAAYDTVMLIDNDGDGKLNCAVVYDITVTSVTVVRSTSINLAGLGGALQTAKNNIEEGLAVGDWVTFTQNPETKAYTVKKAETITGTITATREESQTVRVDTTWYTVDADIYETVEAGLTEDWNLVIVGGYIVAGSQVTGETTLSEAVMLIDMAQNNVTPSGTSLSESSLTYREMQVLTSDGEKPIMKVTAVGDVPVSTNVTGAVKGTLYTYTEDRNHAGCYILTPYEATSTRVRVKTNDDGAITVANGLANGGTDNTGTFRFNNDAVIFLHVVNEKGKDVFAVVTGADVATWGTTTYTTAADSEESTLYATASSNGFYYANLGILKLTHKTPLGGTQAVLTELPGAAAVSAGYGLVLANARRVSANNSTYVEAEIWNGVENVTILANKGASFGDENAFKAGTLVTFTNNGDGTASNMAPVADGKVDAVMAYDGVDTVAFLNANSGADAKITDKTAIIYVDLANVEGEANGSITLAQLNDPTVSGVYNANVYVDVKDDEVVYLFVISGNAIAAPTAQNSEAVKTVGTHTHSYAWTTATVAGGSEQDPYAIGDHVGTCACGDVIHHTAEEHKDDYATNGDGCTIHVHDYTWSTVNDADDDHNGEHKGVCANGDELCDAETVYHAAPENEEGKTDGCTECDNMSF